VTFRSLGGKQSFVRFTATSAIGGWVQSIIATHWLNLSAGVSNCNVFLGHSFNRRVILLRLRWEWTEL